MEIPTDCPEQPFRSTLGSMFCRRQIFENEIQSSLLESLTKIHWKRPAEEVGDKNVETELAKTRARGFSGIRANLLKPYHYRGAAGLQHLHSRNWPNQTKLCIGARLFVVFSMCLLASEIQISWLGWSLINPLCGINFFGRLWGYGWTGMVQGVFKLCCLS